MRKVVMALVLILALCLSTFVACGELNANSDKKDTKSRDVAQTVEDQEDDDEPERVPRYAASSESNIFHYLNCHYVDRIRSYNIVYYYTSDEARRDGKYPCSVCCP